MKKQPEKPRSAEPFQVFWCWDITYDCNYRCDYCVVDFNKRSRIIPAAEWGKIWEDIFYRYGSTHIRFSGGEPFVYPEFMQMLKRLGQYHTIDVTTNLSFDADRYIEVMGDTIHDAHMAISASFHPQYVGLPEFLDKLKKLRDNGVIISATIVAWPPNFGILEETIDIMKKNDIYFTVIPLRGEFFGKEYPQGYSDSEKGLLKKIANIDISPETKKMHSFNVEGESRETEPPVCRMGQNFGAISVNGDVHRCCARKEEIYLGNIIDGTFSLLDEAQECGISLQDGCACYKAMKVGREEEWGLMWHWPHNENGIYLKEDKD